MKKLKKLLSVVLALILCMDLSVGVLSAEVSVPAVDSDGLATFSGSGEIGSSAMFYNTKLKKLVVGEGISQIGKFAFQGCTALTEVSLPLSLTKILGGAFSGCTAIETVYYAGTAQQAENLIIETNNEYLINAEWIYTGTNPDADTDTEPVEPVVLSLKLSGDTVIAGETAVAELSLGEECSRLGAKLTVTAVDSEGKALAISDIKLTGSGSVNEELNGAFVLGENGELAAGAVLARISFATDTPGIYTLSLSGEMYTGEDNSPVKWDLDAGSITVKSPTVTIQWKNGGSLLASQSVAVGSTPVYNGETPTKASDRLYDYTFSGWDKTPAAVTEDTVYAAQFSQSARTYTVSIDCGIEDAVYTVKSSGGTPISADSNGSFRLVATEVYTCTVKAVGCVDESFTLSVADESAGWSFGEDGSAVLSIDTPAAHTGDVDDDGDVDMQDAQALYDYLAGNTALGSDGIACAADGSIIFNSNVADISGNGSVGADDILPMLDLITG